MQMIDQQKALDAIEKCHKRCCRTDSNGDEWIHYETALNEIESIQPTLMRSIGKLVGYTGEPCPNCGRLRVERYESGLEICEKCNWCEQTKSYWLDWEEG